MSDCNLDSQTNSDDNLQKQENYVRSRLVRALDYQTTSLIPTVLSSLAISFSANYNLSDEERALMQRIENECVGIHALRQRLVSLSTQLTAIRNSISSSQLTSLQRQIATEGGVRPGNRPVSPPHQDG